MAATYGRHTGKTGVCLATSARRDQFRHRGGLCLLGGMPMMMITGQKPIKKSKQGRFNPRRRRDDGADHQIYAPDGLVGQYPELRARGFRLAEEENPAQCISNCPRISPTNMYRKPAAEAQPFAPPDRRRQTDPRGGEGARKCEGAGTGNRRGANCTMTSRMLLQFIEKTGTF